MGKLTLHIKSTQRNPPNQDVLLVWVFSTDLVFSVKEYYLLLQP